MSWTPAQIDELRALWAKGLPGSQIAVAFPGKTKNAVIGKAHRLGLAKRRNAHIVRLKPIDRRNGPGGSRRARDIAAKAKRALVPVVKPPKAPDPIEPASLKIPFRLVEARQCRFIADDPKVNPTVCGHPIKGRYLCAYHLGLCWQSVGERRRKNDAAFAKWITR